MEAEELYGLALAIAKANKHPEPKSWADAVVRANDGEEAWPPEDQPQADEADPQA